MTQGNKSGLRVSLLTFCVFLLFISLWWLAARWYRVHLINEKRAEVSSLININGNSLTNGLNRRFALIEGLRAFIKTEIHSKGGLGRDDFDNFTSGLYAGIKGIRAIQAMPGGVVRFVYPMAGNEATLGHDILKDPRSYVHEDVQRTIRTGNIVLSNPFELRQGGLGVVGRVAVYKSDNSFWGLAVIVLDVPPLLDAAGITLPESKVELSLRDKSGKVFHGREDVFFSEPVIYRIALPDGHWEFAGIPQNGWRSSIQTPLMAFHGVCLIIVLLLTEIVYIVSGRQISLATAVRQRTLELDLELAERKKNEKVLKESEEKYRRLTENSPDMIYRMSLPDGVYEYVSPAATRIFGYTPDEFYNKPVLIRDAIHPDWRSYFAKEWENLIKGEMPPFYEYWIIHKSGVARWLNQRNVLVRDENGNPAAIEGIVTDTTERKQAEEALARSEENYRVLFREMLSGFARNEIICDSQGRPINSRYLEINPAFERITGLKAEEVVGRTLLEVFPSLEPSWIETFGRVALTGESIHFEKIASALGIWFDVTAFCPAPNQYACTFIDITERKRAEDELRKHREHLEVLVKERTASLSAKTNELTDSQRALMSLVEDLNEKTAQLAQAMEQAQSADRLKSAFLATMSHELRTPLNSIIGFTGIVLQGMSGPLNDEQAKQLTMVKGSASHLLDLINDVLDISKIEACQVQIARKSFDMRSVIETALRTVLPLAAKKGLSMDSVIASDVGVVISDRRRVEQILINLVNNAVKFTERGTVRIAARRVLSKDTEALTTQSPIFSTPSSALGTKHSALHGNFVEISVADTGIGIKAEDVGKLFIPFSQIDTGLSRSYEGTGLGLSICGKLVEMLGGEIRVESKWGKGSTFTFTLPLA